MKTLLSLLALGTFGVGLTGGAAATQFTTISFATGDGAGNPGLGQSFSTLNDTYTANFSNFVLTSQPYVDVQWTHSFDTTISTANSPATTMPYGFVTQVVSGTISRTTGSGAVSFASILSETITNAIGLPVGTGSQNFFVNTTSTGPNDLVPFTLTLTVPFNTPLTQGFAIKDDLVFNPGVNSTVRVNSIQQRYTPVPEPATLAGLALGGLALLRRRKR